MLVVEANGLINNDAGAAVLVGIAADAEDEVLASVAVGVSLATVLRARGGSQKPSSNEVQNLHSGSRSVSPGGAARVGSKVHDEPPLPSHGI